MIIGTAGHIDHGKTALVRALTGVDGDRLKEEKARGITIDLGFAYLPLSNAPTLGFVDVPGHERFVHTMVAGASGIDFALLVVAADDGVMPQTREHLAIIDLLGIRHGLVALTKADLATPDRLAAVVAEITAALDGTSLADADILPVSALSGAGIDDLRQRLADAAHAQAREKDGTEAGAFRLAVDRAFTLTGVGVVVTGTVLSGRVRVGDTVTISPSGLAARVRSLHAQNAVAEEGRAGDRCALNLAGPDITKDALHRGDMVLAPALHAPTDRIDASLRLLPREAGAKALGQWFPVRLHHAAAEVGARVVLLSEEALAGGGATQVQLVLERPIAAAVGDRYVIRDVSAQHTLGGGRFIDLRPPPRRRRTGERVAQRIALALPDPAAALAALLAVPPYAVDLTAFVRDHALPTDRAEALARDLGLVVLEQGDARTALSADHWAAFLSQLTEQLTAYHAENPDLQGMGREKLRLGVQPRLPAPLFAVAVGRAVAQGLVALDGSFIRLAGHTVRLAPEDEAAWGALAPLLGGEVRFRPPRVRDIATDTGRPEPEVRRILKLAGRMGWADQVAHDHFFLRDTVREMVAIAVDVAAQAPDGTFVVAPFRDRMDNGRKVAIQILDFFDRHGITLRRGDLRRINPHRLDLFGPPVVL
ncbi:selenocysteine-specific translation elongation factor [Azospirillum sp. B4]|uniref:selenocysteine-specific translation elongation factor n=1 Tax=Azospirillum sp. B4 TaxID=95605 RepID=UPI00034A0F12|nr:selenocysteine-specific translation elongation factor [Azospirillum sp. B4]